MSEFELFWYELSAEFQHYIKATEKGMSEKLRLLEKYGRTGELEEGLNVDLLDDLSCTVLATEAIVDVRGFDKNPLIQLKDALTLFFARLKLDIKKGVELPAVLEDAQALIDLMTGVDGSYLTVHELSLLWKMHPNTVRGDVLNRPEIKGKLKKKERLVLIPIDIAYSLSLKRRDFIPSKETEREGMMLVPVTSNDEFFNCQCRNRNGFRIGNKGNEYIVDDIASALSELRTMRPKAYWRRKNCSGNWGIVSATKWELRSVDEVLEKK